jgi:hypothetical protein
MTLSYLEGSWTSPSGVWHADAPFAGLGFVPAVAPIALAAGRAVVAALSKPAVLKSIAVGLGVNSVLGLFAGDETFAEGWENGAKFDQRMEAMHQLWLKLNDRIAAQCSAFVQSPYIAEYRNDRDRFGAFYAKTGRVSARASSYVGMTPSPTATEVGAAKIFWDALLGWIAIAEKTCPGKVATGLSEAAGRIEDEGGGRDSGSGSPLLWIAGGAGALVLLMLFMSSREPTVVVANPGVSGLDFALVRRRRRRGGAWR